MTLLALRFSRYANGVAMQHGKVSREMFPEFPIDSITNGVHAPTWISEPVQQMLDDAHLRLGAATISTCATPSICPKRRCSRRARPRQGSAAGRSRRRAPAWCSIPRVLTLGFARRAATYKRANLLFTDPERLAQDRHRRPAACRFSTPARRIPRTSPARRSSTSVDEDAAQAFERHAAHCLSRKLRLGSRRHCSPPASMSGSTRRAAPTRPPAPAA